MLHETSVSVQTVLMNLQLSVFMLHFGAGVLAMKCSMNFNGPNKIAGLAPNRIIAQTVHKQVQGFGWLWKMFNSRWLEGEPLVLERVPRATLVFGAAQADKIRESQIEAVDACHVREQGP